MTVSGSEATFSAGGMTLNAGKSITVSGTNVTSKITSVDTASIDLVVASGKYTISNLNNGEKVNIDGVEYTYTYDATNGGRLMNGNVGWKIADNHISSSGVAEVQFTIAGDTGTQSDTIVDGYGEDVGPGLAGDLATLMGQLNVGNSYYFKASGVQQATSAGAAYTLTRTESGYTLVSNGDANALTIDLTAITADMNLTINLSTGAGAQQLKLGESTTLAGLTLGAGDSVLASDGTTAQASVAGATAKVNAGAVTLTGGTYVGVGTTVNTIDATSAVIIDGVTFNAGAKGTFTNGTTDTFNVTEGTASISTTFNGTTVKANGVTYTVVPGSTEATFSAEPPNTVTGFTAGKITLTAADNITYNIGNQTVKDGNGAELTFVSKGADNSVYLCSTGTGKISLNAGEAITLSDENGTNPKTITAGTGSTIDVAVVNGKYTLSGLDNNEKVTIGTKEYIYHANTKFLEECTSTYPNGSGDGYILTGSSISFDVNGSGNGTLDEYTATAMPESMAGDNSLGIICRAVSEGATNKYYFDSEGKRADENSAAYTLEKTSNGYVLKTTANCTGNLTIDARGLTNLTVDFSLGTDGKQTLKVDDKTTLTDCTLGTGDVITDSSGNIITCGSGGTDITMGAGEDILVKNMTSGTTVQVEAGRKVKVGNSIYTAAGTGLTLAESDGTIGVQSGTLSATSGTYTMLGDGGQKGDVVTVSGNVEVSTDGTTGKATVKGLDSVGEKAVITDSTGKKTTYEVISPGIVKKVAGDGRISYWRVTGEATFTDSANPTSSEGPLDGTPVNTQEATEGTTYLNSKGVPTTSDDEDKAATFNNNGSRKELEVTQTLELGVQLTGDTVTVKDKGTDTTYVLSDATTVTAREATFTTKNGILSDVTGTIKVSSGNLDTRDGDSDAKYVLSGEESKVNFLEGSSLGGTSVTTAGGVVIIIKESDNKNTTTVDSRGNITGIDGDAEITGVPGGATVTTTGSGILALNGKTWKVEGDSDGATFKAANSGKLSSVAGLDEGATISTEDSVTGMVLNSCTLTSAPEGFSYTEGKTPGQGTFSFAHTGDAIRLGDGTTCKVNQNQDGVSIGTDGKLTGLSDGEKVTITKGTDTYVYEVVGNTLVTTKTGSDGSQSILTSILADGETSFIIEPGQIKAANGSTDASQIREGAAFNAGSTEISAVGTVTNGMMLDRNGKATANRDKLMAEITIEDDGQLLKYTSKKDIHQTVQIGAASQDEWDITTSSQADTVEYGGSKAVSITSGAGNDKITVSGAGEALINGVSGRNTIIHTGTGDATITGGTGNDTIRSAHAGDLISGGGGENTYILSGATTHVTDFAYGMDKAIVSTQAGKLGIDGIKTHSEGRIEYTGTGKTSGSLDVSDQDYGGFYAVTLADVDGHNKLNVAWTGTEGDMIDASSRTEKLLLVGSDEGPVDTLIGGQAKDTLIAGEGVSSMWGGAGNDLLISDDDRESTIFFLAGDGYDTVQGFTALAENSLNDADTIDFYGQGITDVKLTQNGIKFYHGQESMLLSGSYDENSMIKWQNGNDKGVAKIGRQGENNSFRYFGEVTNYIGSSGTDTLTIGDTNDNVDIWLDGREETTYDKIEIIDASQNTGNLILAGGEGANTITGGKGQSSLWGGEGNSKDILNAGSGENTFYYGLNEGNDVINNTKADDKVTLYNLSLSDLKGATIDTSQIIIIQQNGQKLTVNGKAHEFTLADGSTWSADHKTKTWSPVK